MTELHVASTLPPMHIGLNLHFLVGASGGTTTYARELMTSLFAVEPETRVTAFVTAQAPVELLERDFGGEVRWVRLAGSGVGGAPWNSLTWIVSQWALQPGLAWAAGVDVLHGLASAVAPLSAVPTVATVL